MCVFLICTKQNAYFNIHTVHSIPYTLPLSHELLPVRYSWLRDYTIFCFPKKVNDIKVPKSSRKTERRPDDVVKLTATSSFNILHINFLC